MIETNLEIAEDVLSKYPTEKDYLDNDLEDLEYYRSCRDLVAADYIDSYYNHDTNSCMITLLGICTIIGMLFLLLLYIFRPNV